MLFESLGAVSYSLSTVTMAVSVAVCELFSVKACDLGSWVRGRSRSLKMVPFDRLYSTFYWSAIVTIALSCTILEFCDVEQYRDLEIRVRGHSMSLTLVPFESLGTVSYSPSIVIMAVSVAVCEIFSVKEWCDLENRVRVRSSSITRRRIGSHTGSRLNCYVQGRLLQSAVGWSTKVCYRQVAAGHERCSASCERHEEVQPPTTA